MAERRRSLVSEVSVYYTTRKEKLSVRGQATTGLCWFTHPKYPWSTPLTNFTEY